jgi:peptide/nickel transport system substrate-binding protein
MTFALAQAYNEAPQLAQQVDAGNLPPVQERLPQEPMVVPVVERIGTYGGTWNSGIVGIAEYAWVYRSTLYETLVRWDENFTGVIPNIAHSWEVSDDASRYTMHLREGMRWSDGRPFTSADIMFWFEDVVGNEDLSPAGQPTWLRVDGQPAEVTAPDNYTVVIQLAGPNSLFLYRLATAAGKDMVDMQAEYAKQYHIAYNTEATNFAQQQGFSAWNELFSSRVLGGAAGTGGRAQNPDLPTLTAWRLTASPTTRIALERNPYYFKVDAEGNQLPYLDGVVFDIVESPEVLLLRTMSGEIDLIHAQGVATEDNKVLLIDNQDRGSYGFYEVHSSFMNQGIVALNLTHTDPVKREVFNNALFRQALSVAIDRQEIIDLLWVSQGEPWQAAPRADTPYYDEELAKQFTEYDPEQARAWLDEAGYTVGPDGLRIGPDGNPIFIVIETSNHNPQYPNIAEIVVRFWQDIGIDAHERSMERSLWYTRKDNNDQDANIWIGGGGDTIEAMLDPRWYFPYSSESNFAIPWGIWFNNPDHALAEEPPADVQRQMELYQELLRSPTPEGQIEIMRQILDITKDNFYTIGTALQAPSYGVVANNLHNVPPRIMWGWTFQDPGSANPEQFFKSR